MNSVRPFLLALIFISSLPLLASAQSFIPLVGIPGLEDPSTQDFGEYINALYRLAISIAGLLAVLKIIAAGAKYMLTDVVTSKAAAKSDIKGALFGLLIVIGAVVLLNTINPEITVTNLTFNEVTLNPTPPPEQLEDTCGENNENCAIISCESIGEGIWGSIPNTDINGSPYSNCQEQCTDTEGVYVPNSNSCAYHNDIIATYFYNAPIPCDTAGNPDCSEVETMCQDMHGSLATWSSTQLICLESDAPGQDCPATAISCTAILEKDEGTYCDRDPLATGCADDCGEIGGLFVPNGGANNQRNYCVIPTYPNNTNGSNSSTGGTNNSNQPAAGSGSGNGNGWVEPIM